MRQIASLLFVAGGAALIEAPAMAAPPVPVPAAGVAIAALAGIGIGYQLLKRRLDR